MVLTTVNKKSPSLHTHTHTHTHTHAHIKNNRWKKPQQEASKDKTNVKERNTKASTKITFLKII